jgi:hypothetical protein
VMKMPTREVEIIVTNRWGGSWYTRVPMEVGPDGEPRYPVSMRPPGYEDELLRWELPRWLTLFELARQFRGGRPHKVRLRRPAEYRVRYNP